MSDQCPSVECCDPSPFYLIGTCPVEMDTQTLADGTDGEAYSHQFETDGVANPIFAVSGGTLPDGLTVSVGGLLSGTPTDAATFNFQVSRTDPLDGCVAKNYTLTIISLDMPLDQAAYNSSRDSIFGVRGGFVQEFTNAGVATSNRARYVVPDFSDASIAYDSISNKLYALYWNDPYGDVAGPARGIYKINPATLAVEAFIDLVGLGFGPSNDSVRGRMICRNGILYGSTMVAGTAQFRYNIGGASAIFNYFAAEAGWLDIEINGTELWMPNADGLHVTVLDSATMVFSANIALGLAVWGIGVNTGNGRAYVTTRTPVIKRIAQNQTVLADLTLPDTGAKPFCIRYNSVDNKIYCPDETTNSVFVIDGTSETVVTKTGFDSPFDVVFTPTRKFAVQHGVAGLKEIV